MCVCVCLYGYNVFWTVCYMFLNGAFVFIQTSCSIADVVLFSTIYPVLVKESCLSEGQSYHC